MKEYADDGTAIEAMRNLMKLVQLKDETLREIGRRSCPVWTFWKKSGVTPLCRSSWPTYTWRRSRMNGYGMTLLIEAPVKLFVAVVLSMYSQLVREG